MVLSGVDKRVVSKRVVLADVPGAPKTGKRAQKLEREYKNGVPRPQEPERGSWGRKRWKTNSEKMVDFLVPIFSRFTQSFSRFIRDINSEKNISLLMIFFTVSFSRFTPSREGTVQKTERGHIRQNRPSTKTTLMFPFDASCQLMLGSWVTEMFPRAMSPIAVHGSQRFASPSVRSALKSHDSNRKAQNHSNRC